MLSLNKTITQFQTTCQPGIENRRPVQVRRVRRIVSAGSGRGLGMRLEGRHFRDHLPANALDRFQLMHVGQVEDGLLESEVGQPPAKLD